VNRYFKNEQKLEEWKIRKNGKKGKNQKHAFIFLKSHLKIHMDAFSI
jgi:hypothetical protein